MGRPPVPMDDSSRVARARRVVAAAEDAAARLSVSTRHGPVTVGPKSNEDSPCRYNSRSTSLICDAPAWKQ